MSDQPPMSSADETIAREASEWVLRCDRGLTPAEQDRLGEWLAANPRHGAELARHRRHWRRLDALAEWRPEHAARPNPDLLAPPLRARLRRWTPAAIAAAAAAVAVLTAVFLSIHGREPLIRTVASQPAAGGPLVLEDGTTVELNRDAELSVAFTPEERRVQLTSGEAHFFVQKNPARPFVVRAGGVDVRAVGTAFNVRIASQTVEVLVTEGRVHVDAPAATAPGATEPPLPLAVLEARQRAVVPLGEPKPRPQTDTLTPHEIERVLAWQHRMLDFNATPVREIAAQLNRRNVTQVLVVDPGLAETRVSATLRSDNIAGFVRLLELGFGARAEKRGETEILVQPGKPSGR